MRGYNVRVSSDCFFTQPELKPHSHSVKNLRFSTENPTFGGRANGTPTPDFRSKTTLNRKDFPGFSWLAVDWATVSAVKEAAELQSTLVFMVPSIVYFPQLCRTSSAPCRRDLVSRHATVKLDSEQQPAEVRPPLATVSAKGVLSPYLFDQRAFKKHGTDARISVRMRLK